MKKCKIFGVQGKLQILGSVHEKQVYRAGGLPKRGTWTVCKFKGLEWLGKKEVGVFEGGWYPNARYERGHHHSLQCFHIWDRVLSFI